MNFLIVSSGSVDSEFNASLSPSSYTQNVSNGSFTTLKFKAVAENGDGELSYDWSYNLLTSQSASVNINTPNDSQTSVTVSSYNSNIKVILRCEVTDNNGSVFATSLLNIQFGIGGIEP